MSLKRKIIDHWKNCALFGYIQRRINKHFLRKLTNRNFTILCPNCIGGCIYHRLEQQFLSPTINCYMCSPDFVQFCLHLDDYLEQELVFVDSSFDYPLAHLGDGNQLPQITIHFNHDHSAETAAHQWNRRKARINKDNLYIILYMTDRLTVEQAKMLDDYPCNNKVLLTAKPVPEIAWSHHIEPDPRSKYPLAYLGKNPFGLRHYEQKFDFVAFLNKK